MRAARYGNISFCEAIGAPYSPLIEEWLLVAESAENEARQALEEQQRRG